MAHLQPKIIYEENAGNDPSSWCKALFDREDRPMDAKIAKVGETVTISLIPRE